MSSQVGFIYTANDNISYVETLYIESRSEQKLSFTGTKQLKAIPIWGSTWRTFF